MMKLAAILVIVLSLNACKEKPAGGGSAAPTGSAVAAAEPAPPAAPVEEVDCKTASKAYAKAMAATPGNVLSDAKPDDGLIYFTAISMEDYCTGEPGNSIVPWTAQERACLKSATNAESCFAGNALTQVRAGLAEVVASALENQKKNAAAKAAEAGSGAEKAPCQPKDKVDPNDTRPICP